MQRRMVLTSVLLVAVSVAVTTSVGVLSAASLSAQAEERELNRAADALARDLYALTHQGAAVAASLTATPNVADAFARRDRDELLALTAGPFATLEADFGAAQLHFHTPPATSFLRAHQPDHFGDDLSAIRQTVVVVNETRTPVTGLEFGVFGLGLRSVVPVEHEGSHIGSPGLPAP